MPLVSFFFGAGFFFFSYVFICVGTYQDAAGFSLFLFFFDLSFFIHVGTYKGAAGLSVSLAWVSFAPKLHTQNQETEKSLHAAA